MSKTTCIARRRNGDQCGRIATVAFPVETSWHGSSGYDDPPQPYCDRHGASMVGAVLKGLGLSWTGKDTDVLDAVEAIRFWKSETEAFHALLRKRQDYRKRRKYGGIVYFARRGQKVKIGTTTDPEKRVAELERMAGAPFDDVVLVTGGTELEGRLHEMFDHLRGVGEWFRIDNELADFIDGMRLQAIPFDNHKTARTRAESTA